MAEMTVEKLVRAAAALDRIADRAADRFRTVTEKDRVAGAVIHRAVIAVQHREGVAVDGADRQPLITGRGRKTAGAGRVEDDFEVEIARGRWGDVIRIGRRYGVHRLAGRKEDVLRVRDADGGPAMAVR